MTERRIVCVWFPHWPMETWRRARARAASFHGGAQTDPLAPPDRTGEIEGQPFALLIPGPHGDLLHAVNAPAARLGLAPGARAADVAATLPDLITDYADTTYEVRSLARLAAWCRRWSPMTRPDGPDGVALDITGCQHLFGGEAAMLETMAEAFRRQALTPRLASAPCHEAAHAFARYAREDVTIVGREELAARVAPLPVSALELTEDAVTLLRRLGLKTVGALERTPRAALKRRFRHKAHRDPRDDTWEHYKERLMPRSGDVVARLDALHARGGNPLDPERPVAPLRVMAGLTEPVFDAEAVLHHAARALEALAKILTERGLGARRLRVEAFRTDGGRASAELRLAAPSRDVGRMTRLLAERVDGWRAEFGFDALSVEALEAETLDPGQSDGFDAGPRADVGGLVERLSVRLGAGAVRRARPLDSHVPERAERWTPALADPPGRDADDWTPPASAPRPERLLAAPEEVGVLYPMPDGPPARFTWRGRARTVAHVAGPERIAPEWWREKGAARARDYYRVETGDGLRVWLYREGFDGDERGGHPRWFVQGLFS